MKTTKNAKWTPTIAPIDTLIALLNELISAAMMESVRLETLSSDRSQAGAMTTGLTQHNVSSFLGQWIQSREQLTNLRPHIEAMIDCRNGASRPQVELQVWLDLAEISLMLTVMWSVKTSIEEALEEGMQPQDFDGIGIGSDLYRIVWPENRMPRISRNIADIRRLLNHFGLPIWTPDGRPQPLMMAMRPLSRASRREWRKVHYSDPPVIILSLLPGLTQKELTDLEEASRQQQAEAAKRLPQA
jgi:hypothetical protein